VGPLHALVLGVEGVRGGGTPFKSGGMVVKNVAGYQVHKLAVGSLGKLGVLTRVNLRLRPIPALRRAGVVPCETQGAAVDVAGALRDAKLEPACLCIVSGNDGAAPADVPWATGAAHVIYLFEGNAKRVEWLSAEASRAAAAYLARADATEDSRRANALLDFLAATEEPTESREVGVARIAVLPSNVTRAHAELERRMAARSSVSYRLVADVLTGQVIARWTSRGAPLDAPVTDLVEIAAQLHGVARLVHLPAPLRGRFARDLTPDANVALAEKVRTVFDARGTFTGAASVGAVR
jgi:FAD/FMN-containing dehydrogenase